MFMVGAHPIGGGLQRLTLLRRQPIQGLLQPLLTHLQLRHAADLHAVEPVGVFDERLVTLTADPADDLVDDLVDARIGNALPGQQLLQALLEIGLLTVQTDDIGCTHASVLCLPLLAMALAS